MNCENDTAILAPNYFWKWNSSEKMEFYTSFVHNIHNTKAEYNKTFSIFEGQLPKPLKCPYPDSCKGGINSTCNTGYQGTLCATCSSNHYLRFNRCLKCPKLVVKVISCAVILFFKMLLLNRMENSTDENNSTFIAGNTLQRMEDTTAENALYGIENSTLESTSEYSTRDSKQEKLSKLKKSCYRNIFLFLLLSYPITSKKIINILPLPGACVKVCFLNDDNDCISLLKADYSIRCSTSRHTDFWHIAAGFALYPIAFPILLLALLWKCRKYPQKHKQFNFGLKVFYENYKDKYWFWEIVEMYRKLIFISVILLFDSESDTQIGFAVMAASASGIVYTIFRPIKDKFEDRLQTFVL